MKWFLLLVLSVFPMAAQTSRLNFDVWNMQVIRDLNLSDDQKKQIRLTVADFRPRMAELRSSVDRAELAVEEALGEETVDSRKANDAIERLVSARADLTRVLSQLTLKVRSIMTTEQWRELQKRRPRAGTLLRNRPLTQ